MSESRRSIISIVGTTGVGKSQFSIDLAEAIGGEIINADSMQIYERVPIITNKHPVNERKGIPHYVMDHVGWNEEYFIHRFSKEAEDAIDTIYSKGKIPIIIGGTHYYLQQLLFKNKTIGNEDSNEGSERPLTDEQKSLLNGPVEAIYSKLEEVDPVIVQKFHPQDKRKLARALEVYFTTGKKTSDIYKEQKLNELEESSLKYNTLLFWVYSDTKVLHERLNKRVDTMMETGALGEIDELYEVYKRLDPPPSCSNGVWQVIGFKEFLPWLIGNKEDPKLFEEGVERMKIRTRQYSKYQVKWIKKLLSVELQKESQFGFQNGGKLYLLDASDLSHWNESVRDRGIEITKQFVEHGPLGVKEPEKPQGISDEIFPTTEFIQSFPSNKKLGAETDWKHYECNVCEDKDGRPLIAVGTFRWEEHCKSKRHRKKVQGMIKRQKLEINRDN
ncbi:uncharacterized protein KQ657_002863 [Scheffersomyces spartinae]|uniref:tRNA dimethylallyltransferase n=1 Tax=Scheffersomyces spartinae TaxID=45513 RepID=A0A9P8AH34_9ASCO|nr:uncharacterized protein KQ657_002863 [Scheffersomyces spartinae]KAG7191727.1 hypothetical protein KQ657_002863 [Scheffersomyces spartinae]